MSIWWGFWVKQGIGGASRFCGGGKLGGFPCLEGATVLERGVG